MHALVFALYAGGSRFELETNLETASILPRVICISFGESNDSVSHIFLQERIRLREVEKYVDRTIFSIFPTRSKNNKEVLTSWALTH